MIDTHKNTARPSGTYYPLGGGDGIRVLFVGNSITRHLPKPDIGWYRDCGMAASCEQNDYVHLMMKKVLALRPDANFSMLQAWQFESNFETFDITGYADAAKFGADVIIMFFGANVPHEYDKTDHTREITFGEKYAELTSFLKKDESVYVLHSEGFYDRPVLNREKKQVAEKRGEKWVQMRDIAALDEVYGEFNHPNDLGMKKIAEKFWHEIEKYVRSF